MGIFKRLSNLFSGDASDDASAYWLHVRCDKCGEKLTSRIDLRNDLSIQYGQSGEPNTYFCRKTLIGSKMCFNRVEVELTFDERRRLINHTIQGGTFVDKET